MGKKQIIQIEQSQRPSFCMLCAKHLTDLLGTKITFIEVLDELFLYEHGIESANKPLAHFVELFLKDVKEAVDTKVALQNLKAAVKKFGL